MMRCQKAPGSFMQNFKEGSLEPKVQNKLVKEWGSGKILALPRMQSVTPNDSDTDKKD